MKEIIESLYPYQQNGILHKIAKSDTATILIEGESGVGKDMSARWIHKLSNRSDKPFLDINCESLPEPLFESELFGHERRAFPDAKRRKLGLLELAGVGTVYLCRAHGMSVSGQVKLSETLEQPVFKRCGGVSEIPMSARIIAGTSIDLQQAVEENRFHPALYRRLSFLSIKILPLRDRKQDIAWAAKYCVEGFNRKHGKNMRISPEAMDWMLEYSWPGNTRELQSRLERIALLEEGPVIRREHFIELQST